ncbi:hypothetical protein DSAG12_02144 [Promethearchaeum syntrophicum]|uniref:Uncharacterized protein n=1 Tax=Promethearchaeum syntrophicum TaxID=2594042 RepID=A0A5B9DB30_9ARCH|nr:hypothetical protein [Candidatus Prometheoarchaeum syntrophicum]QEE16314.1 hypothetical protein DSAG12_02144 [Candidatus Prometheoarchaeum syntrophicum]
MRKPNKKWLLVVFFIGLSISIGTIPSVSAESSSLDTFSVFHSIKSKSTIAEEYVGWTVIADHYMTTDGVPRLKITVSGSDKYINPRDPDNNEDGVGFIAYVMVTSLASEEWKWNGLISGFNIEVTTGASDLVKVRPNALDRKIHFETGHFEGRFSFSITLVAAAGHEDACCEEQDITSRFTFVNSGLKPIFCDRAIIDYEPLLIGDDGFFLYHLQYINWGTVSISLDQGGGGDIPPKPPIDPIPFE